MVRNRWVQFHVRCTGISITFIIEKLELSSFSINSALIIKEMVWLKKAPCLKVSSFYFGLLTAIKCDTGHKNWESGLKVASLHSCSGGISHPMWQGYWITENRRERNHLRFLPINPAIIYQPPKTPQYNCWEYCGDVKVVLGLFFPYCRFCWGGQPTLSQQAEGCLPHSPREFLAIKIFPVLACEELLFVAQKPQGRMKKAIRKGHGAEVTF